VSPGATNDWFPKQTIGALVDERAVRDGTRGAVSFKGERWASSRPAREDALRRRPVPLDDV
jgi:hypothetical protein